MKVIVDFCLIPLEVGISLSPYIAECQKIFAELEIDHHMHAFGTNLEGEWDTVMDAVKRCHNRVHEMGAVRVTSTLKLGTRIDREQRMQDKIDSVNALLDQS